MTRYTVRVDTAAEKQLAAVRDRILKTRLTLAIARLGDDPRPPGVKKMAGTDGFWRIRVGDWRIIYRVEDVQLLVLVIKMAPRGGVYR